MALLQDMPPVAPDSNDLREWGDKWLATNSFDKKEGMDFGNVFDKQVGAALATMLGGVNVITPSTSALMPTENDAVEVGPVRIVGGIRPQNYDAGYRPDGVRIAFDSKTLNTTDSVRKNFQNMVNDLGSEATTAHTRFPYAVVGFMVVIPEQCFTGNTRTRFTRQLAALMGRKSPEDFPHKAEAMSLVLWHPGTATVDPDWPPQDSPLRIEKFSTSVQEHYFARYHDLPPHDKPSAKQKAAAKEDTQVED